MHRQEGTSICGESASVRNQEWLVSHAYVATIAPMLPIETMRAPLTALTAGPAASVMCQCLEIFAEHQFDPLFIPQPRNPGPPGKAPAAARKTAPYLTFALSETSRSAKPMMGRVANDAR